MRLDREEDKGLIPLAPAKIAKELAARLGGVAARTRHPGNFMRWLLLLAGGSEQEEKRERRDLARLVARAANVLLATTTSGELSGVIRGGKRFDWSIVEEAGKVRECNGTIAEARQQPAAADRPDSGHPRSSYLVTAAPVLG